MSVAALIPAETQPEDRALTVEVLMHLDKQVDSVQSLLEIVLEQGVAIRAREVHAVVRLAGILSGELSRREQIEQQRTLLLGRSGQRLGIPAEQVTLARLATLMDRDSAERAIARSAELRGLLHEVQREHSCNRALMSLELSFLDHLMKTLALDGVNGYDPHGSGASITRGRPHGGLHVLDLQA
jgi:FlgN protein